MKHEQMPELARSARAVCRLVVLAFALGAWAMAQVAPNTFLVHNFVSDLSGVADHQDHNLVNPWGNGFGATPFWIGNNGTGTSTLYDGTGAALPVIVDIPAAGGAKTGGPVTGVMFNTFASNTSDFAVAAGKPASFLFCSLDGIISGWNSSVDSTHALVLFDNSASGAVYTGCVLGGVTGAPLLFAANFHSGTVDVFDGTLTPVHIAGAFVNPTVPAGFAPYNTAIIGGNVYVAYAKQDSAQRNSVPGPGNGYVALFDQTGKLIVTLIANGALNAPWGMAWAPSTFGPFGGALLVGNFADGKINAYNLTTGDWLATLNDLSGAPISFPGLWSLSFGSGARSEDPGTLYFTAGIGGGPNSDPVGSHGLFGSIQPVPSFPVTGIQNAGSFLASDIAPNTWVALKGAALATLPVGWTVTGNTLPTTVGEVGVTVNGEAAPVSFVSNTQINFLVPADIPPGPVRIQTTNNGLTSAFVSTNALLTAPSFLLLGTNATNGHLYPAATHANNTPIGPAGLISGVTTTPAAPGETIVLYGTGFGATNPPIPNGQIVPSPLPLPAWPTVLIDATEAQVTFAGLVDPGLYQINVVVPPGLSSGDHLLAALLGDAETQLNTFVTVAAP
ncbi:MAG: TIGR03118 family protein [Bryobacteraceae bacterium]